MDRPYHHGNLRAELVSAGIAMLEEVGLGGLTLRGIAARAGVSHAAPQRHFGNLRGLLTAIAAEGFRRHAAATRAVLREGAAREVRRLAALEGYAAFARAHPELFRLMFSDLHCDLADPELREAGAESYGVLADIARGLDPEGGPDAQRKAEVFLWSLAHGYATLAISGMLGEGGRAEGPTWMLPSWMPGVRLGRAG